MAGANVAAGRHRHRHDRHDALRPGDAHVNGKNGLTCGVPISDLAVHWDPTRSKKLFKLIAEDRTDDVTKAPLHARAACPAASELTA